MFLKERCESDELKALRYLNVRMQLSDEEKHRIWKMEKGYDGEVQFDKLARNLSEENYILSDLLFEVDGDPFQIDSVIITPAVVYPLDVKNYEGDYFLDDGELYSVGGGQCHNPIAQIKRSERLFRKLLQKHKMNFRIEAKAIFINPHFTLYQAPRNEPIILPTQVNRYLDKLDQFPSKLNERHNQLARLLLSQHITKNRFAKLPLYTYDQLKKGPFCPPPCRSLNVLVDGRYLVCKDCGALEKIDTTVLRHVEEFKLLNPDRMVTTREIFEWCGGIVPLKTVRRVLVQNFKKVGNTHNRHFE